MSAAWLRVRMDSSSVLTVSELNRRIKASLEAGYDNVWIEGEISNLRVPASGHCYLTLKDAASQLRAVMFRYSRSRMRFVPQDGMQVLCRGSVNVYEPRGEYQLVIERMEPRGAGALQLAFEQLKSRLAAEGLFDQARKRPLPYLPRRVGVVTSPTGAAVRDILHVLTRRFPGLHISILPVAVQGEGAAHEIAAAIDAANKYNIADVLIVGRGGGSLEDLWAFNEECVARAMYRSAIPVISAVGHETDFTIADFAADMRAPTPSAAAELSVREKRELVRIVENLSGALSRRLAQRVSVGKTALRAAAGRLTRCARLLADVQLAHGDLHLRLLAALPRLCAERRAAGRTAGIRLLALAPRQRIAAYRSSAGFLQEALIRTARGGIERRRSRVRAALAGLDALNPAAVLGRGFSIARELDSGRLVRCASDAKPGDRLRLTLHRGSLDCRVETVHG